MNNAVLKLTAMVDLVSCQPASTFQQEMSQPSCSLYRSVGGTSSSSAPPSPCANNATDCSRQSPSCAQNFASSLRNPRPLQRVRRRGAAVPPSPPSLLKDKKLKEPPWTLWRTTFSLFERVSCRLVWSATGIDSLGSSALELWLSIPCFSQLGSSLEEGANK